MLFRSAYFVIADSQSALTMLSSKAVTQGVTLFHEMKFATYVEMPWLHELIVGGNSRALTIDGSQPRSIVAAPLWWPSTSPQEKY